MILCLKQQVVFLFFILLFSGCAFFSPDERELDPVGLPSTYNSIQNGTGKLDGWWRAFKSQELNHLVDTALDENFDIQVAWARLKQAQTEVVKSRAGLFPELDIGLEGSRTRTYADQDLISDSKSSSLQLAASYESDLWSKISSRHRANRLSARAAFEDMHTAKISLVGEVVSTWIDFVALRQEVEVLRKQIQLNNNLFQLQIKRFEKGMATALEVTQQKELLASSRSALPSLQARKRLALHELAFLLGRADPQSICIQQKHLPKPIPRPKTGIPVDLLAKRPDVRAAFLRLRSSDWEVSVAKANRLPSLSISAQMAFSSDNFQLAWGDWLTRLGANLTAPLFDAGYLQAEVHRTEAIVDEHLANYALTILEAVKEVRDALANEVAQKEKLSRLKEELDAAKQAREQARIRYLKGQSDYLNFLTQQRSVQSLERDLIAARADWLSYRVALYRALGAGWEE